MGRSEQARFKAMRTSDRVGEGADGAFAVGASDVDGDWWFGWSRKRVQQATHVVETELYSNPLEPVEPMEEREGD